MSLSAPRDRIPVGFALLLCAAPLCAQNGGSIVGTVVQDPSGKPVSSIAVTLIYNNIPNDKSTTDALGLFRFTTKLFRDYEITAMATIGGVRYWGKAKVRNISDGQAQICADPKQPATCSGKLVIKPFVSSRPAAGATDPPILLAFLHWPEGAASDVPPPHFGWDGQAQDASGSVSGQVLNAAGQPVARATLTLTDADGKVLESFATERDGRFAFDVHAAGDYALTIEAEGYAPLHLLADKQGGAPLEFLVEEDQRQNVQWTGSAVRVVLRKAQAEKAEATLPLGDGMRRFVFDDRLAQTLPLAGIRTPDSLALLLPGVVPPPQTFATTGPGMSPGVGTAGQFTVNGLRSRENNFTVDGSDNNDEDVGARRQGFVVAFPQSVESIGEFQVIAMADARFGRSIAAQVNAVSKYGGAALHGTLYGFGTDSRLNARDFFGLSANNYPGAWKTSIPITDSGLLNGQLVTFMPAADIANPQTAFPVVGNSGSQPNPNPVSGKTPSTRTQTGFAVGGPVPQLKDTFFFASAERISVRASRESNFAVPTASERVYNPDATLGVPDSIFSLFPFPNNPLGPYGAHTFSEILPADATGDLVALKLSRSLRTGSLLHSLSGRWSWGRENSAVPVTGGGLFSSIRPKIRTENLAGYISTTISPTLANTFRASFGATHADFDSVPNSFILPPGNTSNGSQFLLNSDYLEYQGAGQAGAPIAYAYGGAADAGAKGNESVFGAYPFGQVLVGGYSPLGVDVYHFPQTRADNTLQFSDSVTKVHGRHTLTAGADFRIVRLNSRIERNVRPLIAFDGLRTDPPLDCTIPFNFESCSAGQRILTPANMVGYDVPEGVFQAFSLQQTPDYSLDLRKPEVDLFLQDEFHIRRNLLVSLGARVETNGLPSELSGSQNYVQSFDYAAFSQDLNSTVCASPGSGDSLDAIFDCQSVKNDLAGVFPPGYNKVFGADRLDWDPRLGFAWDPAGRGKVVVRAGAGIYHDQFPYIILNESRNSFPAFLPMRFGIALSDTRNDLLTAQGDIAQAVSAAGRAGAPVNAVNLLANTLSTDVLPAVNLVEPASGIQGPTSFQFHLTAEARLASDLVGSLSYVSTAGWHLLEVSTPIRGLYDSRPLFVGSDFVAVVPPGASPTQFQVSSVTLFQTSANSNYQALQAELHRYYRKGFQWNWAFTWSHAIDNASNFFDSAGAFALPQDSEHSSERGDSNFDARVRSVVNFTWDTTPVFSNSRFLRGWELSGIYTAQTGQPYTVNTDIDNNRDGNVTARLNTTNGLIFVNSGPTRLAIAPGVSTASFLAPVGQDGALGRNTFRAAGIDNLDLALARRFTLADKAQLLIRAEVFNALNHPQFGIPVRILEEPSFGSSVNTIVPPRTIQVALKLSF